MFNRNSTTSTPLMVDETQSKPMNSMIDFTDRTLDKTFKFVSRFLSESGEPWPDKSTHQREGHWCRRRRWGQEREIETTKLGQNSGLSGYVSNDAWHLGGNSQSASDPNNIIPLDRTKPTNLWAFPAPTTAQHDKCKELDGQSVWTREGAWRCLFPLDKRQVEHQVQLSSGSSNSSLDDRKLFGDYTDYLDWKSGFRKAMRAQQELDREVVKEKLERERQAVYQQQELARQARQEQEMARQAAAREWGRGNSTPDDLYNPRRPVKAQWESAKDSHSPSTEPVKVESDLGKTVVSTVTTNETITKQDGTLETKNIVQKWYKDGTSSVTERITNSADKPANSNPGWFWK